mmetsp:Transcript_9491/g.9021  ORF Transcript_9491/g.9021 Transcript_9491/m.9021 type:complete len:214 (+) Transcript_9491:4343-4984(+)
MGANPDSKHWEVTNAKSNQQELKVKDQIDSDIVDLSSGNDFSYIVTSAGTLYELRNQSQPRMSVAVTHEAPKFISKVEAPYDSQPSGEGETTGKQFIAKRVWVSRGNDDGVVLVEIHDGTRDLLMSQGISDCGLLGQPNQLLSSSKFQALDYDFENVKFVEVAVGENHALGLSEAGELFGWGSGANGKLLFAEADLKLFKPTLLPYFNDCNKF